MLRHIPGLQALKAFDSAARSLSFTKAAHELNVTPAAISHQIKELEDQLGVTLFQRTSRTMHLTRAGQLLRAGVAEAFGKLGLALERIHQLENEAQVRISASPSIAAKWLVPRLDRFLALRPRADVRVDVSTSITDFDRDGVDLAIRFGEGNYPGLQVERLFTEVMFPVCSPELLKTGKPIREPRDLLQYTLIHMDWEAQGAVWPNWRMWMLAAGRLVKPFDLILKSPPQFAYYLICPVETADRPIVKAFRDWVLAEAAETSDDMLAAHGARPA